MKTKRNGPIMVDYDRLVRLDTLITKLPSTLDDLWDKLQYGDEIVDVFKRAFRGIAKHPLNSQPKGNALFNRTVKKKLTAGFLFKLAIPVACYVGYRLRMSDFHSSEYPVSLLRGSLFL